MVGINGYEFIILAIIAVVILGPERLPEYASQLARLVREVRRMATGAREQLREEVGPEIDQVDWRKMDPRQYDPRRIIKEALLDDFDDTAKPAAARPAAPAPAGPGAAPSLAKAPAAPAASRPPAVKPLERLAAGQRAPFDIEAT
ncbi:Sec-independent protein translocase TatB [Arthrobacter zhangbolii]|uniref:Sec-independent protein translocase TatB n=1 Tax=Arthrobacter zhangbolii TaxID=2886936 RepID=A0A9X1SAW5_9MICC|nr:Sec-independent protein translocase TatB [Arthrobacter zhangbolii]MCC3273941.1 Sec-independent protein translocase TatB [Arthrobacter zhangbolii]MCC3294897.1 Sec-independent protein translocase TatB [Arthrobacter zhangbolii]UON91324.1 Sec-independent protein translocase TatB [Arthrobacter zhangbolii]